MPKNTPEIIPMAEPGEPVVPWVVRTVHGFEKVQERAAQGVEILPRVAHSHPRVDWLPRVAFAKIVPWLLLKKVQDFGQRPEEERGASVARDLQELLRDLPDDPPSDQTLGFRYAPWVKTTGMPRVSDLRAQVDDVVVPGGFFHRLDTNLVLTALRLKPDPPLKPEQAVPTPGVVLVGGRGITEGAMSDVIAYVEKTAGEVAPHLGARAIALVPERWGKKVA